MDVCSLPVKSRCPHVHPPRVFQGVAGVVGDSAKLTQLLEMSKRGVQLRTNRIEYVRHVPMLRTAAPGRHR